MSNQYIKIDFPIKCINTVRSDGEVWLFIDENNLLTEDKLLFEQLKDHEMFSLFECEENSILINTENIDYIDDEEKTIYLNFGEIQSIEYKKIIIYNLEILEETDYE